MVIRKISKKQEDFIKGKKDVSKQKKKSNQTHNVLIRIPENMIEKIEDSIEERPIKISRNTWILEAINAYLK